MPGIQDIVDARERIRPYIHRTPLLSSSRLNRWLGHDIYFKAECLQKVGAFKARGALNAISSLRESGQVRRRIIANSSGNHAQAVAWAATLFNLPATIYMPGNVSAVKVAATRGYGAEVIISPDRVAADRSVAQASSLPGNCWIPPYNHEQVIAGQGTAAFEALTDLGEVDAVFAPCGGGGLLSGTLIATRTLSPRARVIGAEPVTANDAARSLRSGVISAFEQTPDTLADGARTLSVGELTFPFLRQLDDFYEISEEKIAYWCQWLNHLLKVRVEPTGAMAMEAVRQWLISQQARRKVLVILSGGNMDRDTELKVWRQDHLMVPPAE